MVKGSTSLISHFSFACWRVLVIFSRFPEFTTAKYSENLNISHPLCSKVVRSKGRYIIIAPLTSGNKVSLRRGVKECRDTATLEKGFTHLINRIASNVTVSLVGATACNTEATPTPSALDLSSPPQRSTMRNFTDWWSLTTKKYDEYSNHVGLWIKGVIELPSLYG